MKKRHGILVLLLVLAFGVCDFLYNYDGQSPTQNTGMASSYCPYGEIPKYDGNDVTTMNGNVPYTDFSEYEYGQEYYSPMDSLGRCGQAVAILCPDTLPTEERGEIGHVRPSGWHTIKYGGIIDGNYLYNRCHLIAFSLAGENDNELNLVTGTRYMNVEGMLPYETQVLDYIKDTGGSVGYRVTPMFMSDELVCRGVLMEAASLDSDGICFCVFVHNIQPGIEIDYLTGESRLAAQ